jgi:hypothetical protein
MPDRDGSQDTIIPKTFGGAAVHVGELEEDLF